MDVMVNAIALLAEQIPFRRRWWARSSNSSTRRTFIGRSGLIDFPIKYKSF